MEITFYEINASCVFGPGDCCQLKTVILTRELLLSLLVVEGINGAHGIKAGVLKIGRGEVVSVSIPDTATTDTYTLVILFSYGYCADYLVPKTQQLILEPIFDCGLIDSLRHLKCVCLIELCVIVGLENIKCIRQ